MNNFRSISKTCDYERFSQIVACKQSPKLNLISLIQISLVSDGYARISVSSLLETTGKVFLIIFSDPFFAVLRGEPLSSISYNNHLYNIFDQM